jgi:hypothetical protein
VARRPDRCVALALVAILALLTAAGCGSEAPQSPPAGVDELVIPTPSPDPADFVRGVDNPWFPLTPGTTWRYRLTGVTEGTLVITVEDATYDVAGVATTPVSRTEPTGEQLVDYYAQDRRGNVWWFGRGGVWRAGDDGAEAGLAMPATPRLGDGWRSAYGPGVVDARDTVVTRDQTGSVPAGRYADLLGIDVTDTLAPDSERRRFFARGVGMVEEISTEGPVYLAELESVTGADGRDQSAAAPPRGPGPVSAPVSAPASAG